jgi:hypothetical protein
MKLQQLYVFYGDEDVASELRRFLEIKPHEEMSDKDGRFELNNSDTGEGTLEGQLKASKWSEVGVGRHTMLFYFQVDEDMKTKTIEKLHIIVRHKTEDEVMEACQEGLKELLTTSDSSVTV